VSQSIRAHFDGKQILLDEPIELQPNTKLLVTVISDEDYDRELWLAQSKKRLQAAYDNNEEEYSSDLIKEPNTEHETR